MAEGDATIYANFILNQARGYINLEGGSFKAALVSGYTPDFENDNTWSDVLAYDYASGGNYVAGGKAITGVTLTYNAVSGSVLWDGTDLTFNNLGPLTPAIPSHMVLYANESTYLGSPLVCAWELGETATDGGPYKAAWSANGILTQG